MTDPVMVAIVGLVGIVAGGIVAGMFSAGTAKLPPYDALAERVAGLERQTDELRRDRDEDRAYIRLALEAWATHLPGIAPPQPVPVWYLPTIRKATV